MISTRSRTIATISVCAGTLLLLSGCSATNAEESVPTVTLMVHDSFPEEDFVQAASEATGYNVEVITAGDGGELTNTLVLTQGAPMADAVFGVDHIFASRLIEHDVAAPYLSPNLPERAQNFMVDDAGSLTPIDLGATCINIDSEWFANEGVTEPETYEDLLKPEYANLTVLLDPTSSSTGASFMIGTIEHFGEDGYVNYWQGLIDNGARVEQGWNEAYYGQFTAGDPDGTKPIVVSYSSSPGYTVTEDGTQTTTRALLETCSSQVEYAAVLAGGEHESEAQELIDFMLSSDFQDTIAESMYVYPIDADAKLPEEWDRFAPLPDEPHDISPEVIGQERDRWLKTLSDAIGL